MARFQLPNLSDIRIRDKRLYSTLKVVEQAINNHSDQGNFDPQASEQATPAPISNLTVTAKDGFHDIAITDNSPAYRGLNYFAYYSKTPDFQVKHKIDLGTSQNHRVFLGSGQFYWAANHSYPTSPGSDLVYHGGSLPVAVGNGAYQGPEMQAEQGSTAFGPKYRSATTPPVRK